ncbi:hypothetical protein ACBZ91_00520 [Vibrio natriegens]|uniref:hypothetical protein n=1 Tax=Vibrio natriegens TaxID=691 RepID=UPI003558F7B5
MINRKEALKQIDELKRTLLPELLLSKVSNLGLNIPELNDNALNKALSGHMAGLDFIELLLLRGEKVYYNQKKDEESDETKAMPLQLAAFFIITDELMKLLQKASDNNEVDDKSTQLDQLVALALCAGYQAGAHDMKVNTERHANQGFKTSCISPRKGGTAKSIKAKPVRDLIIEMDSHILASLELGPVSLERSSNVIYDIIKKYYESNSGISEIKSLFENYDNRIPTEKTIKGYIKESRKKDNNPPETKARRPSESKVFSVLEKHFSHKKITNFLLKSYN